MLFGERSERKAVKLGMSEPELTAESRLRRFTMAGSGCGGEGGEVVVENGRAGRGRSFVGARQSAMSGDEGLCMAWRWGSRSPEISISEPIARVGLSPTPHLEHPES